MSRAAIEFLILAWGGLEMGLKIGLRGLSSPLGFSVGHHLIIGGVLSAQKMPHRSATKLYS